VTGQSARSTSPASVSAEPLMKMIQGLQVTAILRAGIQLGIFDHIVYLPSDLEPYVAN